MGNGRDGTEQPLRAKKTYESPKLARYGDLVEVTRSFGNMGANDSAIVGHNHKTA